MKLQDQVCTMEQAKRLKELGVRQRANIYHDIRYDVHDIFMPSYWTFRKKGTLQKQKEATDDLMGKGLIVAAFTVAELGVMLPWRMRDEKKRENPHLRIYRGENEWHVEYHQVFSRPFIRSYAYENLSNAMAHVLIHLLENKLVTAEEVNARLCA